MTSERRLGRLATVGADGSAALVVDDVLPPWRSRAVEVRGSAVTLGQGGEIFGLGFDDPIIRITPSRIVSWGLER